MEKNTTTVIAPFKSAYLNKKFKGLNRIFKENNIKSNALIDWTFKILELVDNIDIEWTYENYNIIVANISKKVDLPCEQVHVILKFLFDEKHIDVLDGRLVLTQMGRLFTITDKTIASADMFSYFWENCDWRMLSGLNEGNRLIEPDARRYLSLLFTYNSSERLFKEFNHIEPIEFNINVPLRNITKSKTIKYIVKYILEPIGIVKISEENGDTKFIHTKAGQKIFEYYSRDLVDEYNRFMEECWECYDRGNFQQAYDIANSVISVVYNNLEAYNIIGCVYIKRREYEKAKDTFIFALNLMDKDENFYIINEHSDSDIYLSIYYNLGLCYFYMGDFISALQIFKKIRKNVPCSLNNVEELIKSIKKMIIKTPVKNS